MALSNSGGHGQLAAMKEIVWSLGAEARGTARVSSCPTCAETHALYLAWVVIIIMIIITRHASCLSARYLLGVP